MPDDLRSLTPLADQKIVTLAVNLPGPVAAARLRDLGATVVKIEPPGGDPLARGCPEWYASLHENVSTINLDLKDSAGRARFDELLADCDLLLTSSRPAALDRLGLGWESLHARFSRLCQVAIIGHGRPHENKPGHDLTYQASLGLVDPPHLPRALLADLGGAEEAVTAALALLLARERGRRGQLATVSLADAAARHALPLRHGLTSPAGLLGGGWPGYNLYEAADGWIAVAALEPHFVERLVRELGVASLSYENLSHAFRKATADEWENWASIRDLPIQAVRRHPID
jgi:alpha-methylacyl-CoA racemase